MNFLSNLENLKTINISGGKISGLPNMENMKSLTSITITGSALTSIDNLSGLPNKEKITRLNFGNNSLYDLTAIKDLSNLSYLFLENNKIETFKNTYLNGDVYNADILNELKSKYNKLTDLYIKGNKFDQNGLNSLSWAKSK